MAQRGGIGQRVCWVGDASVGALLCAQEHQNKVGVNVGAYICASGCRCTGGRTCGAITWAKSIRTRWVSGEEHWERRGPVILWGAV